MRIGNIQTRLLPTAHGVSSVDGAVMYQICFLSYAINEHKRNEIERQKLEMKISTIKRYITAKEHCQDENSHDIQDSVFICDAIVYFC